MTTLILTYHAIEEGPAPLCISPRVLRSHLDAIASSGAEVLTVSELVERMDEPPERAVAITFDDGFCSVVEEAAPMLHARGMPATVFAVAGHLGADNGWPTQPPKALRRPLASGDELAALVDQGWEIGSHGLDHAPLTGAAGVLLERELIISRVRLEAIVQAPVRSYAYPYGALPGPEGRQAVEREYAAACTTELGEVEEGADPHALPRLEVHYVRRADLLARALEGSLSTYLGARRMIRRDFAGTTSKALTRSAGESPRAT